MLKQATKFCRSSRSLLQHSVSYNAQNGVVLTAISGNQQSASGGLIEEIRYAIVCKFRFALYAFLKKWLFNFILRESHFPFEAMEKYSTC